MTEKRGSWYLLTGVIIGLILGMILSHWVVTVKYVNVDPSTLNAKDKQAYRVLVAQAYLAEGDVYRALARLDLLKEKDPANIIVAQAQNMMASGGSDSQARALALLAAAINEPSLAVTPLAPKTSASSLATPTLGPVLSTTTGSNATGAAPLETKTPGPTGTPRPTATPMATAGAPFAITDTTKICDPPQTASLLEILVMDASGQAVPGVRIEISQAGGGVEAFYTGLYPQVSRGYADYTMQPGVSYTLRVGDTGQPINGLTAPSCGVDANNKEVFGSLRLMFQQR